MFGYQTDSKVKTKEIKSKQKAASPDRLVQRRQDIGSWQKESTRKQLFIYPERKVLQMCPLPAGKPPKKAPNPDGKKGCPAHQQEIKRVVADIEQRGFTAQTERKIDTPGGEKPCRFADVIASDATGKVVEVHQVGKVTKGGQPVSRERKAKNDIQQFGGLASTPFTYHKY